MKNGNYIGIDFGTTNTAVISILSDDFGSRKTLLGEDGDYPFSSIVAIPKDGGPLLFGRKVREQRLELSETHDIYLSMKSYLGTEQEFFVGEKRCTATDITAEFLKYVKKYIKTRYNIEIDKAAFSYPVDFSPKARRELKKAAERAGIAVTAFVSESTAAYIANREKGRAFSKVMVIDWGGGTLDISVLDLKQDKIYESAVWGERIGGDDIDNEFARRMHARIAVLAGTEVGGGFDEMTLAEKDQMIMRCEQAKIEFSQYNEDYPFSVKNYGSYGTKTVNITCDFFEDVVTPIIHNRVLKAIKIALDRGGINGSGIDAVILVGGSCNLRPFANAITQNFGEEKIILPEKVQWSVATGAAMMEIVGGDFCLNDDVGVLLSDESVYPVLKKGQHKVGSTIGPITFSLTDDSQDAHFIFITQDKNVVYSKTHIRTKGFLKENLQLTASVGDDQIAVITIENHAIGEHYLEKTEINKLTFYYNLAELDKE